MSAHKGFAEALGGEARVEPMVSSGAESSTGHLSCSSTEVEPEYLAECAAEASKQARDHIRKERRLAKNRRTAASSRARARAELTKLKGIKASVDGVRAELADSEDKNRALETQLTQASLTLQSALPLVQQLHTQNQSLTQQVAESEAHVQQLQSSLALAQQENELLRAVM